VYEALSYAAHRSKRIFAGDRILAVDSVTFDKQTTIASLQKALIGSDERGSTVAITVQHPPTALGVKRHAPSEADWTLGKVCVCKGIRQHTSAYVRRVTRHPRRTGR
jgi:hypothetical protein